MQGTQIHNKIKSASDSVSKVSSLFKQAQMGTMGPDEVKDFVTEAVQTLDQVTDTLTAVAQEVPATEEQGLTEETPSIDNAPTDPAQTGPEVATDTEEPPARIGAEDDDDPEKKEMQTQIASLNSKLASMERTAEVKEIATKYASLWPQKQQSTKFASIMKSKDSIQVLTARLSEAESLLSRSKVATSNRELFASTISSGIYSQEGSQKSASMKSGVKASSFINI